MYNLYSLEKMAYNHHNELLKEAENYRIARISKNEDRPQTSLSHRLLKVFYGLIIAPRIQDVDRVSFTPSEANTSGSL